MKIKLTLLFSAVTFGAALLPHAALADSLFLTLSNPIQNVSAAGGTLSYTGTISAAASNTGFEYLNGDSFSYSGPGVLNDDPFFNAPIFLTAGQSFTGVLFRVVFGNGVATGVYPGSFSILGGNNSSSSNTLATATFQANVAVQGAAVTPEPSSLLLLGTGLLGAMGAVRRRLQA